MVKNLHDTFFNTKQTLRLVCDRKFIILSYVYLQSITTLTYQLCS